MRTLCLWGQHVGATFRSPATKRLAPPTEVGGSPRRSRALQCAGFRPGVAVRMALLCLLARGGERR